LWPFEKKKRINVLQCVNYVFIDADVCAEGKGKSYQYDKDDFPETKGSFIIVIQSHSLYLSTTQNKPDKEKMRRNYLHCLES